jgi:DNA polymerase-3 subunit alpha
VRNAARMMLRIEVSQPEAFVQLATILPRVGAVKAPAPAPGRGGRDAENRRSGAAAVALGQDFALDGDLVEVIAAIEGVTVLSFAPQRGRAQLRLVA